MNKIQKALRHVRTQHPEITMVLFSREGSWNYCDEVFNSPTFSNEVEFDILEKAADEAMTNHTLPKVFNIEKEEA